jgi:hypothetical protein
MAGSPSDNLRVIAAPGLSVLGLYADNAEYANFAGFSGIGTAPEIEGHNTDKAYGYYKTPAVRLLKYKVKDKGKQALP